MFDKLKNLFTKKEVPTEQGLPKPTKAPKSPKVKEPVKELTDKEKATLAGEPFIAILSVDLDPNDINNGAFELDWNDKFIINLIKAGYKFKDTDTDTMLVDRWFQETCRNVVLSVYEQQQADPTNRTEDLRNIKTRDLGNGRTEVS